MNIAPPITPENLDVLAPYIVGFARVSLGDMNGFKSEGKGEDGLGRGLLVSFSWFEDGKLLSLSWSEAVQRFGNPAG